ncbi:MAG TPA: caspase family protein, partial [Herpetosiphonaceae bacterium]|nr:caspase family protein [Herpetosiphonaceae bacterium]
MGIRGLFVGINQYSERPLRGCVNDVTGVRDLLQSQHGLPPEQTRLLTDGEATRAAIVDGLRWLAQPDDGDGPAVRIFHYAGHGVQRADDTGDEPDGSDECLQPFDHATAGLLTDDSLAELYGGFLAGTRLLLLMDCCHSGTISKDIFSDVRYRFTPITPEEHKRIEAARHEFRRGQLNHVVGLLEEVRSRAATGEELGQAAAQIIASVQKQSFGKPQSNENVVLLAACKPEQTAADAKFGDSYHGAMTFFL